MKRIEMVTMMADMADVTILEMNILVMMPTRHIMMDFVKLNVKKKDAEKCTKKKDEWKKENSVGKKNIVNICVI